MARPDQALYERCPREEAGASRSRRGEWRYFARHDVQRFGRRLRARDESQTQRQRFAVVDVPPAWTVMYITANGRALPCCIAPFSQRGYENYTLGDATQQTLRDLERRGLSRFPPVVLLSDKPPAPCASCGLHSSL